MNFLLSEKTHPHAGLYPYLDFVKTQRPLHKSLHQFPSNTPNPCHNKVESISFLQLRMLLVRASSPSFIVMSWAASSALQPF